MQLLLTAISSLSESSAQLSHILFEFNDTAVGVAYSGCTVNQEKKHGEKPGSLV